VEGRQGVEEERKERMAMKGRSVGAGEKSEGEEHEEGD
jgi:hypothetical protein